MNTSAYILYLFLTYLITVHVGLRFYRNGRIFILRLLQGDERVTDAINRLLLTGYYLLNLGYASLMLVTWRTIASWPELLSSVLMKTGAILLTLGTIHFFNMGAIYFYRTKHNRIHHHKTTEL